MSSIFVKDGVKLSSREYTNTDPTPFCPGAPTKRSFFGSFVLTTSTLDPNSAFGCAYWFAITVTGISSYNSGLIFEIFTSPSFSAFAPRFTLLANGAPANIALLAASKWIAVPNPVSVPST